MQMVQLQINWFQDELWINQIEKIPMNMSSYQIVKSRPRHAGRTNSSFSCFVVQMVAFLQRLSCNIFIYFPFTIEEKNGKKKM